MQGALYQEIMKQVIENSQVTFEEEGVEASVLEELRMVSEAISSMQQVIESGPTP